MSLKKMLPICEGCTVHMAFDGEIHISISIIHSNASTFLRHLFDLIRWERNHLASSIFPIYCNGQFHTSPSTYHNQYSPAFFAGPADEEETSLSALLWELPFPSEVDTASDDRGVACPVLSFSFSFLFLCFLFICIFPFEFESILHHTSTRLKETPSLHWLKGIWYLCVDIY